MFNRREYKNISLIGLLNLAAITALIAPTHAVSVVPATRRGHSRFGLFNNMSASAPIKQDALKITCPDSKDVEDQLNHHWALNPRMCDTISTGTYAEFYQLPNPLENFYGALDELSCHPKITLSQNNPELAVVNQTCFNGFGNVIMDAYIACSYNITSFSSDCPPVAGSVEIGCDFNKPWLPNPGYFALFAWLRNATQCSVQDNAFLCQRAIPLDPMSGIWQPVDGLFPFFNYDNEKSTVQYTLGVIGTDGSTCCPVQVSGNGALEGQSPLGDYAFIFNPQSVNVTTKNETSVCDTESPVFRNQVIDNIYGIWLRLQNMSTMQISLVYPSKIDTCNIATTLTRIQTKDTPSIRPRF